MQEAENLKDMSIEVNDSACHNEEYIRPETMFFVIDIVLPVLSSQGTGNNNEPTYEEDLLN